MATIPDVVRENDLSRRLKTAGLTRVYQGKVRDTYVHPVDPRRLIVVATDRISIFDIVLPATVPQKGEVLTALTHFWLVKILKGFPHHLVPERAPAINPALPAERTLVIQKLAIPPFEMIFRAHLGGSVWKQYLETGVVAGYSLPRGFTKWQKLQEPLFTPSTKVESGHDVNVTVQEFLEAAQSFVHPAVAMLREAYRQAYEHARSVGIRILDTKFEIGLDGVVPCIADEVLTPDSSRFTTVEDFEEALQEGRDPVFYDKEPVRNWGRTVDTPAGKGINRLDPKDPQHLAFVSSLKVPSEVVRDTTSRYLDIFQRLTGMPLERYQEDVMGV